MSETIIVPLLSLLGTILGTFGGILTASKLTNYRIEQLEKQEAVRDEEIKNINHQIEEFAEHN